jgi:hypothetical protein
MHEPKPGVYFLTSSPEIIAGNKHVGHPPIQLQSDSMTVKYLTVNDVLHFCSNLTFLHRLGLRKIEKITPNSPQNYFVHSALNPTK